MELVKVEKLNTGYDEKILSKELEFSLFSGEIVSLIGPNGSGKSTLLKTIASIIPDISGEIYIKGIKLCKLTRSEKARLLSVMLTKKGDYEYSTCKEVIAVGRYQYTNLYGKLSEKDEEIIKKLMVETDVDKLADKEFSKLSDGQKQRVLLCRALVQEPSVLILDEPTSFLDIGYKIEFMNILKRLAKEKGIGILMSLHELDLAYSVSDRVIAINSDNQVEKIGKAEDILTKEYIAKLFNIKNGSYTVNGGISLFEEGNQNVVTQNKGNESKLRVNADEISADKYTAHFIMIQGTMSSAGKSLLAAGLCRIFKQDGYRVAPFKSQNMALNSFITEDGLEMGRAQVMQAEAAGVKPSVYMNPILLKPSSDTGSQVIINGKVYGNMKAKDYFEFKKSLVPHIKEAVLKLQKEADIIVIEGAGSPAEINLKENDIVNMGMAKLVDAPVLLAGDIDRGGVFAQLLGTINLLTEEERARVGGLIINKFRGDKTILDPGVKTLEELSNIPVIGVIPYMDINLEDEDSLTKRFERKCEGLINIAVIKLPHISNFTDFDVFELINGVSLNYVKHPSDLSDADMIILPGSKNTMADMKWLREQGFCETIKKAADKDIPVFGICGGFQMLGNSILDPQGIESKGSIEGLGLLNMVTEITTDKITTQSSGEVPDIGGIFGSLSGKTYNGYEIHMGVSTANESVVNSGNVYGTYIHGFFDNSEIVKTVIESIANIKECEINLDNVEDYKAIKEHEYDRLADIMRAHLDMDKIYKLMGINND